MVHLTLGLGCGSLDLPLVANNLNNEDEVSTICSYFIENCWF